MVNEASRRLCFLRISLRALLILGLVALRPGGPVMQGGALTHAAIRIATEGERCRKQH